MKSNTILFISGALLLFLSGASCDSLPGTTDINSKTIVLKDFRILPDTVSFVNANVIKDTTITIQVSIKTDGSNDLSENPIVHFYEKKSSKLVISDTLRLTNSATNEYSSDFKLSMSTGISTVADLVVTALNENGNPTNFLRKDLVFKGFQIQKAIVNQIFAPDTVKIPATGSSTFLLSAEVVHPDKQQFISKVFVQIKDKNNEEIGIFRLYDDGSMQTVENGATSGDTSANDTIFTRAFTVTSTNQADILSLTFYAVDVSNQESNRVSSTLVFEK